MRRIWDGNNQMERIQDGNLMRIIWELDANGMGIGGEEDRDLIGIRWELDGNKIKIGQE